MCRFIVNVYLMRYAGIVIGIDENDEDVREGENIAVYVCHENTKQVARAKMACFFFKEGAKMLEELTGFL